MPALPGLQIVKHYFIHVTPAPLFTWLKRLDDGMTTRVEVTGGMLVWGRVAAPNVAAGHAQP